MSLYTQLAQPLLFRLDAEQAHQATFRMLRQVMGLGGKTWLNSFAYEHPALKRELWGLQFRNPLGLAAGMDKNAELLDAWAGMGFGFVEVGTVTPKAQEGNPKPRLFRLQRDRALINRMGFNNAGMAAVAPRLEKRPDNLIVGVNIGKNKATEAADAAQDYLACFERLAPLADYVVVNVSSPNTPGLRELQSREPLKRILAPLQERNRALLRPRPLLLKLAPDLAPEDLQDAALVAKECLFDGLVVANTTIRRMPMQTSEPKVLEMGAGGLSGPPLLPYNVKAVEALAPVGLPIIGVGGIHSARSLDAYLDAGASLVQVYTALVYEGPDIIARLLRHWLRRA